MILPPPELLIPFLVAGLALNLTPGPDMTFVASVAGAQGERRGLVAAVGIFLGCAVHILLAVAGVSALLAGSRWMFDALRVAGAAYLVYAAIGLLRGGRGSTDRERVDALPSRSALLRQAFLVNLLNPKVGLFFLAFLPQFVDPSRGATWPQLLSLGLLFNVNGTVVNALVALGVGHAARRARELRFVATAARWLAGSILLGFAARLAFADRPR